MDDGSFSQGYKKSNLCLRYILVSAVFVCAASLKTILVAFMLCRRCWSSVFSIYIFHLWDVLREIGIRTREIRRSTHVFIPHHSPLSTSNLPAFDSSLWCLSLHPSRLTASSPTYIKEMNLPTFQCRPISYNLTFFSHEPSLSSLAALFTELPFLTNSSTFLYSILWFIYRLAEQNSIVHIREHPHLLSPLSDFSGLASLPGLLVGVEQYNTTQVYCVMMIKGILWSGIYVPEFRCMWSTMQIFTREDIFSMIYKISMCCSYYHYRVCIFSFSSPCYHEAFLDYLVLKRKSVTDHKPAA